VNLDLDGKGVVIAALLIGACWLLFGKIGAGVVMLGLAFLAAWSRGRQPKGG